MSVVGPSGCGKSTLLNLLAGLAKPDLGTVETFGEPVDGRQSRRRLHLPARRAAAVAHRVQNVALPLRYRGQDKAAALATAREWLGRVGLTHFADSYPHQLSGGMRKRVAIAATLAYQPRIILMDEPFSALDVQTRTLMEDDLLKLWATYRPAVLFITHDLEEAVGLSDRVVVMSASPGRVIGDHAVPLDRPRTCWRSASTPPSPRPTSASGSSCAARWCGPVSTELSPSPATSAPASPRRPGR